MRRDNLLVIFALRAVPGVVGTELFVLCKEAETVFEPSELSCILGCIILGHRVVDSDVAGQLHINTGVRSRESTSAGETLRPS